MNSFTVIFDFFKENITNCHVRSYGGCFCITCVLDAGWGKWKHLGNTAEQSLTNEPKEAKLNIMHTGQETEHNNRTQDGKENTQRQD